MLKKIVSQECRPDTYTYELNLIKKDMTTEFKTVFDMNLNDASKRHRYFPFSILFFLQASSLFLISFSNPCSVG